MRGTRERQRREVLGKTPVGGTTGGVQCAVSSMGKADSIPPDMCLSPSYCARQRRNVWQGVDTGLWSSATQPEEQ